MTKHRVLFILTVTALLGVVLVASVNFLNRVPENTSENFIVEEPAPEEVVVVDEGKIPQFQISGVTTAISDSYITVRTFIQGSSSVEVAPVERDVSITEGTKIILVGIPNPEESKKKMEAFQAEMAAYTEAVKALEGAENAEEEMKRLTPPTLPTATLMKKYGARTDIKVGDEVSIVSYAEVSEDGAVTADVIEVLPTAPKGSENTDEGA